MNKKDNCFTLIRYIVALTVIYQHARQNGLNVPDIKIINWIDKVPIFFFISGYTVMMSLTYRKQTAKEYFLRRFLRLYPELWLSIILEVVLFVVQFPYLLKEKMFYLWILARTTFFQFWTSDILRFYGGGTPNGALWTIIVTVQFYFIIYFLYKEIMKLDLKQDILMMIILIGCNSALSFLDGKMSYEMYMLLLQTIIPYAYMFYFGIVFYKYSDDLIPFCRKYFWAIVIVFVVGSIFNYYTNFIPHTYTTGTVIHVLLSCLLAFSVAYKFSKIKIKNDYSYGIYIYHMIVMNFFIQNRFIENDHFVLLAVYLITFVLAIISNKLANYLIRKLVTA